MGRKGFSLAFVVAAALVLAAPATAQVDTVVRQATSQGVVGEQADGYIGIVAGANANADVRARVDQINIRRRAVYTQRAAANGATASEMAAAVACQIFRERIAVGERYRDEGGAWRTHTASTPVAIPSFCTN